MILDFFSREVITSIPKTSQDLPIEKVCGLWLRVCVLFSLSILSLSLFSPHFRYPVWGTKQKGEIRTRCWEKYNDARFDEKST